MLKYLVCGIFVATTLALPSARSNSLRKLAEGKRIPETRPFNVAHRGASGVYPEHTEPAYEYAIEQGADALECDVVLTRDLQLLCLHEAWISALTNIGDLYPEDRKNSYFVQDQNRIINDYFTVDFTLEELENVALKQRFSYRNSGYDYEFPIVSFEKFLQIITDSGKPVIAYAEIKDRVWQNQLDFVVEAGTTIEDEVIKALERFGCVSKEDNCIVQSFNADSVEYVGRNTNLRTSVLLGSNSNPSNATLEAYTEFASGISTNKRLIVTSSPVSGTRTGSTDLVERAHAYGLFVHVWTFRNEDRELLWDYEQDPYLEYLDFLDLGVDGVISDFPGTVDRLFNSLYEYVTVKPELTRM